MTTDLLFKPSGLRIPADMIDPMPVSKQNPDAANGADARRADRELVGRRGSAPVDPSRPSPGILVSGKDRGRPHDRVDTPAGAGNGPMAADDRHLVLQTELPPWRMICALTLRSRAGAEARATGWLVGPRTIITAGHHLHNPRFHGGWAESIIVSAGRYRSSRPFSRFTATRFAAAERWVADSDPDFNIGCIQLDCPLGDLTGWFGLASPTAPELDSALVNISGYPADRGQGAEQYFQTNRIAQLGDRQVSYDIGTIGALAGAPVWIHRTPSAPPVVVAMQAGCAEGLPAPAMPANSALRITPEIFDMIKSWIHQDISVAA